MTIFFEYHYATATMFECFVESNAPKMIRFFLLLEL